MNPTHFVPFGRPPLHIALLPDGGRRWAKANRVSLSESYYRSVSKLDAIIEQLFASECDRISVCLSGYNNHVMRSPAEVSCIERYAAACIQLCIERCDESTAYNLEVYELTNAQSDPRIERTFWQARTAPGNARTLALFVGYNALIELTEAMRKSVASCGDYTQLVDHLWISRPIDCVVRTGGYKVLSGFAPLATGWSRLYFLDELFNDVESGAFAEVVWQFLGIPRHYGE
jgi:undecaprenyl diphosphate synthase